MLHGAGVNVKLLSVTGTRPFPHESKLGLRLKICWPGVQFSALVGGERLPFVIVPGLGSRFPLASKKAQPVGMMFTAAPCLGEINPLMGTQSSFRLAPTRITVVPLPEMS